MAKKRNSRPHQIKINASKREWELYSKLKKEMDINGSDLINALLSMVAENKIDKMLIRNEADKILGRLKNYKKGDILDPDRKYQLKDDKQFLDRERDRISKEKTKRKKSDIKDETMKKIGKYVD